MQSTVAPSSLPSGASTPLGGAIPRDVTSAPAVERGRCANSPFMNFWRALNEECLSRGYPEPTFGPAHRAWVVAVDQASNEAFAAAWRAAQ